MPRPLVSIVMATYQRAHLLTRSLASYACQDFDRKEIEFIIIDDHSTDHTRELCLEWSRATGINVTVMTTAPKLEKWRDCGAILNVGIRASSGEYILLTHPEIIPGKMSVRRCVENLSKSEEGICPYVCCRAYYLSPREQVLIDSVDLNYSNLEIRKIPGFYEEDGNGAPDYTHRATDIIAQPGSRLPYWESWIFGGFSRRAWAKLGGMLETQKWGSVDVAFVQRRRTLGIPNHTCPEEDSICIHQNHDLPGDEVTPRVESDWKRELHGVDLTNPNKMIFPAVDYLGW